MTAPFVIGRVLFGGFFIYSGINQFRKKKEIAQYAKGKNVPVPDAAVIASGALILAGGTSIVLGVKPKLGTLAIMGFLASASLMIHDFWRDKDPNQRMHNMVDFSKNLALLASALTLMGVEEPWPASVPAPGQKLKAWRRAVA